MIGLMSSSSPARCAAGGSLIPAEEKTFLRRPIAAKGLHNFSHGSRRTRYTTAVRKLGRAVAMMYHIDTDMGVDDGLALLLADRLLPAVAAISTVFGNVPVDVATRNALIFRALLGRAQSWPILQGAARAAGGGLRRAIEVHGEDGMGGAIRSLDPAFLAQIADQPVAQLADPPPPRGGKITLIGLGPATNIPGLVAWYGRAAIARIVLMAGVFFDNGNITPMAEFNAFCDPNALRATLDLGLPVTIIPLDVCRKVVLPRAALAGLGQAGTTPIEALLYESHMKYMDFYRGSDAIDGCFPHDAIAVLAAMVPDRFYRLTGTVEVDGAGARRGRTSIALSSRSHVDVVTGGDLKWVREVLAGVLAPLTTVQEGTTRHARPSRT
jgi:inosine-uridine nucleoside N-ribohydrolase